MSGIIQPIVGIVLGSQSDEKIAEASGMFEVFDKCSVGYELSIISAHRNRSELSKYCADAATRGIKIIIAAAGWSAALPGDIAAELKFERPVMGMALPSTEFPNALDALLAITRMPKGCPLICAGTGEAGLKNAALIACQILALDGGIWGSKIKKCFQAYLAKQSEEKPAQIAVKASAPKEVIHEGAV